MTASALCASIDDARALWDRELSEKMQGTLLAFAKIGNPNTRDVKTPRYDPNNEQRIIFGDSIHVDKMNTQQIEFLRTHVPRRPAPQRR